ncbi:hypothetical protein [Peribacillus deserti]|uniref:Uncharacterized protein n=1 Tax=Peribacillus deserti TaxID=673318 RepID=A0A2N5M0J5_9BACI|nr:hypothetical protein [Peribacillus deserti]PLT27882.1 hypothetical protein CUU66_21350 [Peribacillus deserti]
MEEIVSIGATCRVRIRGRFFLLVEIEVEAGSVEIEGFVFRELSEAEAWTLSRAGIPRCQISRAIPRSNDTEAELICIFIVDGQAFAAFDVEDDTDEAVLFRIRLREALRLITSGRERLCPIIRRHH